MIDQIGHTREERGLSEALLVGGFGALAGMAVVAALMRPARGYEFSIYEAVPLPFWVLAGVGLFVGQVLILRRVFGRDTSAWRYGLVLIVAIEVLVLLLPYLRGYVVFNRSDVLTHLGYIQSIHQTDTIGTSNIYPNIHLLVLTLAYATGVKPIHLINTVPVIVTAFSVGATYAFVTTVFDRRLALATLPFAVLLIGGTAHTNPSPFAQTVLVVPFVLYLFARSQRSESVPIRATLGVVLISLVLYHPLTTLFLLFVIGIYAVVRFLSSRGGIPSSAPADRHGTTVSATVAQLTFAAFVAWYSNFIAIVKRFQTGYERLLESTGGGTSPMETYSSAVARTSPALVDLLTIGAVKFGQTAFVLGLGSLYVAKTGLDWLGGRVRTSVYERTFAGAFVLFTGLGGVFLVVDLFVGFGRLLIFARIFGALLAGVLCYDIVQRFGARRAIVGAIYLACAVMVVLSVVGVYHSPLETRQNQQVTAAEIRGSDWVIEHRASFTNIVQRGINMWRFRDLNYGVRGYDAPRIIGVNGDSPPPHFGYGENATLGAAYGSDRYFILTELGRTYYQNMYPDYRRYWDFKPADFRRLERDSTVSHIYDNGEFDAYYVNATG